MSQARTDVSASGSLPDLIADLRLHSRRRQDAVQAEGNLTRQMRSIVARYLGKPKVSTDEVNRFKGSEALAPLFISREPLRAWRRLEEKAMAAISEQLPVYHGFWKAVPGLGALGLAQIIGESGDLSNYSNPAKLWRRFGLHVGGGRAYATWRSQGGLTAQEWEAAGYSPRRRSLIYTVTDSLLKKQNPYRRVCEERKQVELAKAAAERLTVAPAAAIPKGKHDQFRKYRSLGHIKARAERYVSKRLLRDLWRAWRDAKAQA